MHIYIPGTVSQLKRFGEYSGKPDEEWAQKIMFAQLEFGNKVLLMTTTILNYCHRRYDSILI